MATRGRKDVLAVWMNGERVGWWRNAASIRDELAYDEDWLHSDLARPLSLSLPFTPGNQPLRGEPVRAFFDNLLPDSQTIRERLAAKHRTRSADPFELLRELGRDCAGAIQLLPESESPTDLESIRGVALGEGDVERILANVARTPALGQPRGDDDLRISIAGAQEKTALLWHRKRWYRPLGSTPSTHILKLPLGRIGNLGVDLSTSVENEWLCGRILAAYDVPTASSAIARFGDQKVLVVERFDRRLSDDRKWWVRLPQEDFCQALAVPSWRKYEPDGGPGIRPILKVLEGSLNRDEDRRDFYRAQILFWMLAATDGHAKNFSLFLEAGGAYRMTPLYDVISALPVVGQGKGKLMPQKLRLAMAVRANNAHYRIGEIQRRHWNAMARRCGLARDVEDLIHDLIDRTPRVVAAVSKQMPADFPQDVVGPILDGLAAASRRLGSMPAGLDGTRA